MSSPGWTKKPCEACGSAERQRRTGEICEDCKLLIQEAKDERERQANSPRRLVRLHHKTPHWNPSYYDGDGTSDSKHSIQSAVTALVFAIGEPAVGKHSNQGTPGLLPKGSGESGHRGYDSMYRAHALRFTSKQVAAFKALDTAIRKLHKSATEEAFEHGSNLLRRLGEGDLSLTDFEDRRKRYVE